VGRGWAGSECGAAAHYGAKRWLAKEMRVDWRTSAYGLRPTRKKGFFHFLNLIFTVKTFPRNPRKCFKAQKILRKFQKFQENSQS
jgi:hypothetical protein